ncbi:HNH endonuclease [Nocardioides oleivorans]|uniref:HNH endonuclease n=1 Tax=Nocardioides oleivorans TaxID=273676 RepID=A0A4V1RKQ6_9ACTN|nr:HNH endonuclease signature motif containing protein [Nocardioides oleivorans]RYB93112.1 HNH endonuclease [Nocardioides oleivorans]
MPTSAPPPLAPAVAALRAELQAATGAIDAYDDAALVDAISELETLGRMVSAAQAALTSRLAELLAEQQAAAGARPEEIGRGIGNVVAAARRESPHRGRRHLGLARIVPTELPHTWAAWQGGRVDEWTATVIARETACLPLEHRRAVDEAVAEDPEALERLSPRQLLARLRSEAERLDPAACVARRRLAEGERRVTLRPAPDSMTWLTALLPVKDGVAVYATLTKEADISRAAGDSRTRGQVMADGLVAAVRERPAREHREYADETGGDPPTVPRQPVELGLVMSDAALFGGADDDAHLEGFGPIPAELAREIVCGALTDEEELSIRRLYASPTTGELMSMDSRRRTFRGSLARFIRLRDRTCRTPWCDAPVRHIDHVEDHAGGGTTSAANGAGLCEACNYAKTALRWRARAERDGSVTTTLPTGHTTSSRPPPVATITRRRLPPLVIDYILTG